jgi:hemerythrin-like metal-binding protein
LSKPLFDFESEFKLGIEKIDREHATLVNMLNKVHSLMGEGKKVEAQVYFRRTLASYVVEHFTNEEIYMESIHFPQLSEHRQIHDKFKQSFFENLPLIESYDETAFRNALTDTFTWIINHIGKTDRKYARFGQENLGS